MKLLANDRALLSNEAICLATSRVTRVTISYKNDSADLGGVLDMWLQSEVWFHHVWHVSTLIQCINRFFVNILIQPKFQAMLQTWFLGESFFGCFFKVWYRVGKSSNMNKRYYISQDCPIMPLSTFQDVHSTCWFHISILHWWALVRLGDNFEALSMAEKKWRARM